ncbi:hypothetical protein I3760_03G189300 [Carya illinoinensis]|nr:hypothetical protein I3760_03G189300 [Carya illinoinensis]
MKAFYIVIFLLASIIFVSSSITAQKLSQTGGYYTYMRRQIETIYKLPAKTTSEKEVYEIQSQLPLNRDGNIY